MCQSCRGTAVFSRSLHSTIQRLLPPTPFPRQDSNPRFSPVAEQLFSADPSTAPSRAAFLQHPFRDRIQTPISVLSRKRSLPHTHPEHPPEPPSSRSLSVTGFKPLFQSCRGTAVFSRPLHNTLLSLLPPAPFPRQDSNPHFSPVAEELARENAGRKRWAEALAEISSSKIGLYKKLYIYLQSKEYYYGNYNNL